MEVQKKGDGKLREIIKNLGGEGGSLPGKAGNPETF